MAISKGPDDSGADSADAPPISALLGVVDPSAFWPLSLAHLGRPYGDEGSDYVTIAEISEAPKSGFAGCVRVSVALVPHALLESTLRSTKATGHEVRSHGPLPFVHDGDPPHRSGFWIEGFQREVEFEPLINSWRGSDIDVLVPDCNILMVFGLVPRQRGEFEVSWDDPHRPLYDVVRVSSASDHQQPKELRRRAYVEMRRDYLLEYCRIKQCAAVAFYFERRWSEGDSDFDRVIGADRNVDFNLPGRLLSLQVDGVGARRRQLAQVWGRRLVVARGERRVLNVDDPQLTWPDHSGAMTMERAAHEHLFAYIKDEVLQGYENRPEFEIHPLSGSVSYRGQWAVSFCDRMGREHIRVELKKLYEGARSDVVEHWHRFAVPRSVAQSDQASSGDRNIGSRAQELVLAYLALTEAIARVAELLGLSFSQAEIGVYDSKDVDYRGWWTVEGLSSLAHVVPKSVTQNDFLDRSIEIVKLLESLKEAPLRNSLVRIGVEKKDIASIKSLKLLAALCQISTICRSSGYRWPEEADQVLAGWDKNLRVSSLDSLFSVNQLRLKAAHRTGANFSASLADDLKVFGIVPAACIAGWGGAVDELYDRLIKDFTTVAELLTPED